MLLAFKTSGIFLSFFFVVNSGKHLVNKQRALPQTRYRLLLNARAQYRFCVHSFQINRNNAPRRFPRQKRVG